MLSLHVAPGPRHPTASRIEKLVVEAELLENLLFAAHPHEGLVVAVAVHYRLAFELRRLVVLLLEELAQDERLATESPRIFVVGEEVRQLITKYRDTARLEAHYRHTFCDVRAQHLEDLPELALGEGKHTEVVERAAAAQVLLWHLDPKTGVFEDLDGGLGDLWVEVIVEGVRPQDHGRPLQVTRAPLAEPLLKRLWGEGRDRTLGGYVGRRLHRVAQERRLGEEVD